MRTKTIRAGDSPLESSARAAAATFLVATVRFCCTFAPRTAAREPRAMFMTVTEAMVRSWCGWKMAAPKGKAPCSPRNVASVARAISLADFVAEQSGTLV